MPIQRRFMGEESQRPREDYAAEHSTRRKTAATRADGFGASGGSLYCALHRQTECIRMPTGQGTSDAASTALCEAIARWSYESLPPAVVHTLKTFLLDEVGVIAGAARSPGIAQLNNRLSR